MTKISTIPTGGDFITPKKCPRDSRTRPIYILLDNVQTLAMADGKGHAYKVYGEGYDVFLSKCLPENKYDPKDYTFLRGLSGMEF